MATSKAQMRHSDTAHAGSLQLCLPERGRAAAVRAMASLAGDGGARCPPMAMTDRILRWPALGLPAPAAAGALARPPSPSTYPPLGVTPG